MILLDANLLIYAVNSDAPQHKRAKEWLEAALSGPTTVAFSWIVLLAFLRITTRPGLFAKPLPLEAAFHLVDAWLDQRSATVVHPGSRHHLILRELLLPLGTGGNLTSDAHLAALALEHGAEIYSADADFARFARVKWRNPLSV
jgi:toxin-antitoxin system PIN domain toxin